MLFKSFANDFGHNTKGQQKNGVWMISNDKFVCNFQQFTYEEMIV